RYDLCQGQARRLQRLLQYGQPCFRCLIAVPLQEPLEMLDHGIESAVGVIRGTVQRQPWRALVRYTFSEHAHQAGFANTRLAAEPDHLAQSVTTLRPALLQ